MAVAKDSQPPVSYPFRGSFAHYDEAFESAGLAREHYAQYFEEFLSLGDQEIARRWDKARRRIQEDGVTFCVYGEGREEERAWKLDPIPLLIPPADWARLEQGLRQRAELLDHILADLYGEQRLIREGLLPPELVFGNPAFLRPCRGTAPVEERRLRNYAADLARSPDGAWWIIDDRTQAPSGVGYALENRMAITQVFPDVFRGSPVARLVDFYAKYRDGLLALEGARQDPSRVVVLSPGPHNEIYFEHSYLARFLGFALAEGGDLTVRDNRVYLKTLDGLHEIGAILRKMDDDFCDPLELRADSLLGVPGLVHAVRRGNVSIANMLGSGVLESRALMPFLPLLCRRFFDQKLILPSVATWWCGQKDELKYVLDRFDAMTIKAAFPSPRMNPIAGRTLSAKERERWIARIRRRPHLFVAQEHVALSSAPVWENGKVEPRHLTLRCHAISEGKAGGWSVMPGGLGRVTASAESTDVSMQMGGGSKDVWVLTGQQTDAPSALMLSINSGPVILSRSARRLPSRVADNLFWLGRYVERGRGLIALARAALQKTEEEPGVEELLRIRGLECALERWTGMAEPSAENETPPPDDLETKIGRAIFDRNAPGSLASTLDAIRRTARPVSDRFSDDCWLLLNRIENVLGDGGETGSFAAEDGRERLREMTVLLAAFGGMVDDGMIRSPGWRFLEIGRCLERAANVAQLLQGTMAGQNENEAGLIGAVLEATDSAMTYRLRYFDQASAAAAIDLTILDESNPHAIAFQLSRLIRHIEKLPRRGAGGATTEMVRLLDLHRQLLCDDPHRLAAPEADGAREKLDELLSRIREDLYRLSEELSLAYFSHSEPARQLRNTAPSRPASPGQSAFGATPLEDGGGL